MSGDIPMIHGYEEQWGDDPGDVRQAAAIAAVVEEYLSTCEDMSLIVTRAGIERAVAGVLTAQPAPSGCQRIAALIAEAKALDDGLDAASADYHDAVLRRLAKAQTLLAQMADALAVDALSPVQEDWRALITPLAHFVARERALRDAEGKGGPSVGNSPRISPSVLKELERVLAPVMAQVEKTCALSRT